MHYFLRISLKLFILFIDPPSVNHLMPAVLLKIASKQSIISKHTAREGVVVR